MNKVKSITAKYDDASQVWRVICECEDGSNVVLGNTPTERGARRMVTVHKKFHGLK